MSTQQTLDTEKTPDFDSAEAFEVTLPGSDHQKIQAVFNGEMLGGYNATVLTDSVLGDADSRLTTFIVRFPRCVLAEVNTHRVFSRNSASSRARSMRVTITELMEDPYIPLFTKNQRGMGGGYLSEQEREKAVELWLDARDSAVVSVLNILLAGSGKELSDEDAKSIRENYAEHVDTYNELYLDKDESILSPHKQNVNRLLEPFMWHEAIISATDWENYFDLRDHVEAQPEIRAIARLMKVAMDKSVPVETDFHVPFEDAFYYESAGSSPSLEDSSLDALLSQFNDVFMSSAGDCARVSYKSKLEQGATDSSKLGYRLLEEGHLSPFEHVAVSHRFLADEAWHFNPGDDNFNSHWVQFRTLLNDKEQV